MKRVQQVQHFAEDLGKRRSAAFGSSAATENMGLFSPWWDHRPLCTPAFAAGHHCAQALAALAQHQAKLHVFLWLGSPEPKAVAVGEHV